jgi:pantoate--beta-alanine ligase
VVGFVPTMGALHRGHLTLVEAARQQTDAVVVSIFVNPLQFGPQEDLDRYPRQLEQDVAACSEAGVDVVYAPSAAAMYPEGFQSEVSLAHLPTHLCGASRPGHFAGVATVVAKLLLQVGPCRALFGRKDYQQFKMIERLVVDLDIETTVVGVPTVREADGVALSSRNAYLSPDERGRARALVTGLAAAYELYRTHGGELEASRLRQVLRQHMDQGFDRVDYADVYHAETLVSLSATTAEQPALLAGAGWIGSTRLIDNVVLGQDPMPVR